MAGRQRLGAEIAGDLQQVAELDALVAAHAGYRRPAGGIGVGEILDHRGAKALLEVEHVVGDAQPLGDRPGILDVLAGAAGTLAAGRGTVVVELQGDADHLVALPAQQAGDDRAVDAAGHRHDDRACQPVSSVVRGTRTSRPSSAGAV